MALNRGTGEFSGHLPCGRTIDSLWQHIQAGAPPSRPPEDDLGRHARTCPHCRRTVSGLRALDAAAQELAVEDVTMPTRLLHEVMRTVLAGPARLAEVPVQLGVSTTAVAEAVRFAVDTMPNARLRAGHCRVEAPEGVADALDATVEVLAPADREVDEESVRRRVGMVITAHAGLRLRRFTLTVLSSPNRTGQEPPGEPRAEEQ